MSVRRPIGVALAIALGACHGDQPRAAPAVADASPQDTLGTAVTSALDLLEQMAAAVDDASSCGDKAKAMQAWTSDHVAERQVVAAKLARYPAANREREMESQLHGHLREHLTGMSVMTLHLCQQDQAFMAAWTDAQQIFATTP